MQLLRETCGVPIRRSQCGTFRPLAQPKAHESGRGEGRYQAEARLLLAARHHPPHQRGYKRRWRQEPNSAPATASPCCFCALPPAMASLKDLEGKWRLLESHGFEEYMKELGETLSPNPSLGPHPCGGCVGSLPPRGRGSCAEHHDVVRMESPPLPRAPDVVGRPAPLLLAPSCPQGSSPPPIASGPSQVRASRTAVNPLQTASQLLLNVIPTLLSILIWRHRPAPSPSPEA